MSAAPVDHKDLVPGTVYRIRHKERGVFEGRVQVIEQPHNNVVRPNPRGWFTCEITKIRKNDFRTKVGDKTGFYLHNCEFKTVETKA